MASDAQQTAAQRVQELRRLFVCIRVELLHPRFVQHHHFQPSCALFWSRGVITYRFKPWIAVVIPWIWAARCAASIVPVETSGLPFGAIDVMGPIVIRRSSVLARVAPKNEPDGLAVTDTSFQAGVMPPVKVTKNWTSCDVVSRGPPDLNGSDTSLGADASNPTVSTQSLSLRSLSIKISLACLHTCGS